jgi:hypothetical protein
MNSQLVDTIKTNFDEKLRSTKFEPSVKQQIDHLNFAFLGKYQELEFQLKLKFRVLFEEIDAHELNKDQHNRPKGSYFRTKYLLNIAKFNICLVLRKSTRISAHGSISFSIQVVFKNSKIWKIEKKLLNRMHGSIVLSKNRFSFSMMFKNCLKN